MAEKKKGGLHKGIETLFPGGMKNADKAKAAAAPKEAAPAAEAVKVKITSIEPNRDQPRRMFDEESLRELSDSIKQYGLLQPILVQERGDHYEIIAGERRWRASRLAGLREVPVIIRNYSEREIVELSLIENIQREDLNPIEEAQAYQRLLTEFNLKQDDVAKRVSKNRTTITNALRLLRLTPEVQNMVIDGRLSSGHARALVAVEDETEQKRLAVQIVSAGLSVRETEKLAGSVIKPQKAKEPEKKGPDEALLLINRHIEEQLRQILGTKVSIKPGEKKGGKLEIAYYNNDDLARIAELMGARMAD